MLPYAQVLNLALLLYLTIKLSIDGQLSALPIRDSSSPAMLD